MSVDFIALRKLLLLSQKNLHLFFFAKTRTGIKHLKVFYINAMCPLCHGLAVSHQFRVITFGSLSTNTNQYKSFRQ